MNMHFALALEVKDYGPVHWFWCFSFIFERANKTLSEYHSFE